MTSSVDALFQPVTVGRMALRNRIMLPPHARVIASPFGSPGSADRFISYYARRARDGAAWIGGLNCYVGKRMVPGFEPSGVGVAQQGDFRLPHFRERAAAYGTAMKSAGAFATAQLTLQGGMPYSPSGELGNYTNNLVPHVLTASEIQYLIGEYAYSSGELQAAGLDGAELHANHEDVLQLFLSPATNHRADEYGGGLAGRARLVTEILAAIRDAVGSDFTLGVRLNMDEMLDGGYSLPGGLEIARLLERTGHIDYVSCVIGSNWGAPSYLQSHHYGEAQWSEMAGAFRDEISLPVVYSGRVSDPRTAARVIARGHADVVGVARAVIADGTFVSKARQRQFLDIRPCIGTNDCLHRVTVDHLRFGCSVNPRAGNDEEALPKARRLKSVLVAGGGPAGLELAGLLAERGHQVALWEREPELGGQMRVAARAAENSAYSGYLAFQDRRLRSLGVQVVTGREATRENVLRTGAEVVAVATGARSRRPAIPGIDLPHVMDGREVLMGTAEPGERVVVLAMEDQMQPLTIAGFLADLGRQVTLVYPTPSVAALVGKYSIGAPLARLSNAGAAFVVMQRVVQIAAGHLVTRNIYSGAESAITGFDSVVLACGGVAESALYDGLTGSAREVHILGDAYAPRRISFATRQALMLARQI
jgi:2,4-dienoyl-CoA reductase-like NADH-dependent reductase (Old Yellow Enzyme family)/thioredoxin reductase